MCTRHFPLLQEDTKKVDKTRKRLQNARLDMDSARGRYIMHNVMVLFSHLYCMFCYVGSYHSLNTYSFKINIVTVVPIGKGSVCFISSIPLQAAVGRETG